MGRRGMVSIAATLAAGLIGSTARAETPRVTVDWQRLILGTDAWVRHGAEREKEGASLVTEGGATTQPIPPISRTY